MRTGSLSFLLRSKFPPVLILCCLLAAPAEANERLTVDQAVERLKTAPRIKRIKGRTGNFTVSGEDSGEVMGISKWTSEMLKRLDAIPGFEIPFDHKRQFSVVLRGRKPAASSGKPADPAKKGRVLVLLRSANGRGGPSLVLDNYYLVDRYDAMEGLCRLVLSASSSSDKLPLWFTGGVAQNLFVNDKARNNRRVKKLWKEGRVPSVKEIISGTDGDADRAMKGVLMEWVLSYPSERGVFKALLKDLSENESFGHASLASVLFGPQSEVDLDAQWDRWILNSKSRIYEFGRMDLKLLAQLRSELLLYRGTFAIPLEGETQGTLRFSQLMELKKKHWIKDFCQKKRASLQLLALGKAKEFSSVVVLYCDYLTALESGKSNWRLRKLLKKADKGLSELEKQMGGKVRLESEK